MEDKKTIEELFEEIEKINTILEDKDIPLEQAMKHYEEGMALIDACQKQIDRVEKQMLIVKEDGSLGEFH